VAEQVPDKADHFRTLDGILNQLHVEFERRRHPGDRGKLWPITAVAQNRSPAPRRPSSPSVRSQ
jgi:hypothetical protein